MTQQNNISLDRRSFLSSTAIIGGSLVLSSKAFSQDSAANALNIAIIGAGTQGQALLNACLKIPGIRVKAVCDIWQNYNLSKADRILTQFNQEHKLYTDYQEMLAQEKDLHAVIIATPDLYHAEQTIACLKAGIPVYCESMMSNTIDGAKLMLKTAKETGKLLQIGHQRRSNPRYQYAFNHILNETKLIGKLSAVNGQWNRPVQPAKGFPRRSPVEDAVLKKYGYDSMDQFRNWQWYKKFGNGPLAELTVHQIDVFNWYLGATPKSIIASGGTDYYDQATHEWPDTLMAVFEYPNAKNTIRALYQTINMNSNFGYYENFMGDEGTLYVSESSGRVKVYREPSAPDWSKWVKLGILSEPKGKKDAPKKEGVAAAQNPASATDTAEGAAKAPGTLDIQETVIPPEYEFPVQYADSIYKPHLENFFNAIRGKEKLNCPPEIAFASTVTVLKIYEAMNSNQKAVFKPEDFQV